VAWAARNVKNNERLQEDASIQMIKAENALYVYVSAFVDELQRSGVHHAVICPGSRSTPLALCLSEQSDMDVWMHVDERSAAFFALGMAKRLQQPVALVCTSGTAAANFLPAIVEAKLTHVPLLILTADRPPELRDCGAPQAIDQNRLYGTHVKWYMETALPEASNSALRYIRTLACRAAALTLASPIGPVHLNMPFREPLTPNAQPDAPLPPEEQRDPIAWSGRDRNEPFVDVEISPRSLASDHIPGMLWSLVKKEPHGLIIAGSGCSLDVYDKLIQIAHRLNYPILADPLSHLRNSPKHDTPWTKPVDVDKRYVISTSYDAFLRLESFVATHKPGLILRFGAMPTSKPLLLYLKRYADCPQVVIDENDDWQEPTQQASVMINSRVVQVCNNLLTYLGDLEHPKSPWFSEWRHTELITKQTLLSTINDFQQPFEGRIFTELNDLLPDRATLYVGNSMPVRDLDTFFWGSDRNVSIIGNRGANGIDGVISSALGYSAGQLVGGPTVLVIGDLSFYHDLNGLLAACMHNLDLLIILVNNDGGGIFSFLPQAAYPEHFEQLFGTPTGLDFAPVVAMYGGTLTRPASWEEFREAVQAGMHEGGLHVVEVKTDRESNVTMHRQLWQAVEQAL
jgi:2-succinyl-5-enolpyruvyl-6-hydroxy-3-cyclohexene-1-carboxylate synthase